MNSRTYYACFVSILITAAMLRLPRLDLRPFHGDEAVHAYKLNEILHGDGYHYDPYEFHGPTLNFFTLPLMWARGVHDYAELDKAAFRIVPVLFGLGLILLLPLIADGLGRGATLCGAALTAVSPLMVFTSRYYVQEMLLVFFTFALLACGWRYVRSRRMVWALLAGACAGLMHATKETSVIALGAMGLALIASLVWNRRTTSERTPTADHLPWRIVLASGAVAVVVSVAFFSSFFTNIRGPLDSMLALKVYLSRGTGETIHLHRWYYYVKMLLYTHLARGPVWSEALIVVLAAVGLLAVNRRKHLGDARLPFVSFVALYTVLMVVIYSALPYKTPWSMLGFVHGMILLAGLGAAVLLHRLKHLSYQIPVGLILLALFAQLTRQSIRTNLDMRFVADARNPYVYAHPLFGVEALQPFIERLADVHPDGRGMLVKVIMRNPWPLPWYLRRLDQVGYWESHPDDCDAPVVITASDSDAGLADSLSDQYESFVYSLRPDVRLIVYVNTDLMRRFRERESGKTATEVSSDQRRACQEAVAELRLDRRGCNILKHATFPRYRCLTVAALIGERLFTVTAWICRRASWRRGRTSRRTTS